MNADTDACRSPAPCRCAGVLAISMGTALLTVVLLLAPGAPMETMSVTLARDGAPPAVSTAAAIDDGVDWQRVERSPDLAGAAVAAYDCPPADTAPTRR